MNETNKDSADSVIKNVAESVAREQGGTELSGGSDYTRPQQGMSDISGGNRENTNSMGDGWEDWFTPEEGHQDLDY